MEHYHLALTACVWRLDSGTLAAECPSFPEFATTGDQLRPLLARLRRGLARVARGLPRSELFRRHVPQSALELITVSVTPPVRTMAWEEPLELQFALVVWSHSESHWIAWVPHLGIHVLGRTRQEVLGLAPGEIKAALARGAPTWTAEERGTSLPRLAEVQRSRRVRIVRLKVSVPVSAPRQAVQQAEHEATPRRSVLKETTDSVTQAPLAPALGRDELVRHFASILSGRSPRCVLLVGPSGVGKTAVFQELVRRRSEFELGACDFRSTTGARLVAGMTGFGMWQERCQALCREVRTENVILHLGPLFELLDVGKCEGNSQGIASFLRPALVRGTLLAVAECTPEQLALIERLHPQLVAAFEILRVPEPDSEVTAAILARCAADFPRPMVRDADGSEVSIDLIDAAGLAAVQRLHRRYATYSAVPGRPLRFLRNLLRDRFDSIQLRSTIQAPETGPLTERDVIAAFARETGLPVALLDDAVPFRAEELQNRIRQRVVGQQAAVDAIINLLATIKSGLARSGRPLASLLFIGPTGVGKTELARTLAELLFGDELRLTRFDMSEYGDPLSAQRLAGGNFGDEGVLTAKVREQPFSVILLDEFEKADRTVFDLMLQVLGEGRLTDGGGRLADFTNAVLIMTSNLGAESYQQGAPGFARQRESGDDHFLQAVRKFFRPELFNRFDAVIPFESLNLTELRGIARQQLNGIRARDGIVLRDRGWAMTDPVIDGLVNRGFDPRYGARPLKRVIERELLAPLAEQLNALPVDIPITTTVTGTNATLEVRVRPAEQSGSHARETAAAFSTIADVTAFRRQTRDLLGSGGVQSLRNEVYRLESELERERRRMLKRSALGKPWKPAPDAAARMSRAARLRTLINELDALNQTADAVEDQALLGLLLENRPPLIDVRQLQQADAEWWRLAEALYLEKFPQSDRLVLGVFSESPAVLNELSQAYQDILRSRGTKCDLWEYSAIPQESKPHCVPYDNPAVDPVWFRNLAQPARYQMPEGVVGLAVACRGPGCFPRFLKEAGVHVFTNGSTVSVCLVTVECTTGPAFRPPAGITRRGAIARRGRQDRRSYDQAESQMTDHLLNGRLSWRGGTLVGALTRAIELSFKKSIEASARQPLGEPGPPS